MIILLSATYHQNMISEFQKIQQHKLSEHIFERLIALIWKGCDGKILEIGSPGLLFPISLIHPRSSLPIQKITLAQGPRREWGSNYQVCHILLFKLKDMLSWSFIELCISRMQACLSFCPFCIALFAIYYYLVGVCYIFWALSLTEFLFTIFGLSFNFVMA